jgi:hypothetical protein
MIEILRLPDGRRGVAWGGAVFPLLDGNRIEETGEAFPPSLCRPFVADTTRAHLVVLEQSGEAYIFLDGSAAERDRISRELTAMGVMVVRAGPNGSDHPGDWFLRLAGLDEMLKTRVASLIEGGPPAQIPSAAGIREALLTQSLRSAMQRQADLAQRMREALTASAAERAQGAELLREVTSLQSQLEALARRTEERPAKPTPRAGRLLRDEVAGVAAALLPRLRLLGGSVEFMATELSDRGPVWRALGELDRHTHGMPIGWKAVAGKPGWWERHFATGQDNQGRLYARLTGTEWGVLVSHKQGQAGDIRNLG